MQRTLSALERAIELASLDSPINFALTARLEGRLGEGQLRSALERLVAAHPLIASRIVGEDERTGLVRGPTDFSVRTADSAHDRDWVETTRGELLLPFHRRVEAPVRFTLLWGAGWTDLVVCCDHAVSDGLSAAYLIGEILRLAGDPEAESEPATAIPPALPDLAPEAVRRSLRGRLRVISWITKATFPVLRRAARFFPARDRAPASPEGFRLMAWDLDEAATARLVAAARRERTTVHAALCAAFLTAFAEDDERKTRRVSCPISLRERTSSPVGKAFGLLVSIVETSVDCSSPRSFWEVARDLKARLSESASDKRLWLPVLAADAVMRDRPDSDLRLLMTRLSPKIRYDLSITNLGRLDFPGPESALRLRSLHGPAVSGHPDERILGVSTAAGRMSFVFTFRDHTTERRQAEAVRARAMDLLATA